MQKAPYWFKTLSSLALSQRNSVDNLIREGMVYKTDTEDLKTCLETKRAHDAHLVQYKLFTRTTAGSNKYTPSYFRLCSESLELMDLLVEMDLLVFDYDFGADGAKLPWSKELMATTKTIEAGVRNEQFLKHFWWSPTQNGIRFIAPIVPVEIGLTTDLGNRVITAGEWRATYRKIAKCIDTSNLPQGHFDIKTPANYFSTFRMPRVVKPNGFDLRRVPIFFGDVDAECPSFDILSYYTEDEFKTQQKREGGEFELHFKSPEDKIRFEAETLNELYNEEVFTRVRQERMALAYTAWRGLGSSIAASTSIYEDGEKLFDQLSSWGPNYNAGAARREWRSIWRSKSEGYGPYTYMRLAEDFPWIKEIQSVEPSSSPAGTAFKRARATLYVAPPPVFVEPYSTTNAYSVNSSDARVTQPRTNQQQASNRSEAKTSTSRGHLNELEEELGGFGGGPNPITEGIIKPLDVDEVKGLLRVKMVGSGENVKEEVKKDLVNLEIILTYDSRFYKKFKRNVLGFINLFGSDELTDECVTWVRTEIVRDYGIQFQKSDVEDKVKELCVRNQFNPITNYLIALPKWDKIDRIPYILDSLSIYPENPHYTLYYTYMKKFLISAVTRPLQYFSNIDDPSVNLKVDTLLVLQGEQGLKKSTFFETLVPMQGLFSDSLQSLEANPKDANIHMLNYWIIEFSEFDGLVKRSSQEFLKAFISRKSERFRPPYTKAEITAMRPSILVGTTNAKTFLNDPTGSRRFWVISLGSNIQINVGLIAKNRDAIWAQAVALFEEGEQWWLTPEEQIESNKANEGFGRQDPWEDSILSWVANNPIYDGFFGFRLSTLFEECLKIDQGRMRTSDTVRVKQILEEQLGLEERRERIHFGADVKRIKVWRRPHPTATN